MCGFIGEVGIDLLAPERFKDLLNLSKQRGPDQQDIWKDDKCQLGFNRLSILDTSIAGKQPIISPSGRYTFVFNGEIYNYKDLQRDYNIKNGDLRSGSDSEIIAHLLDILSIENLAEQLNGMFAIAVWDREMESLSLLRDFAGIKPLYYGIQDGTIIFASQFNQVFKHPIFNNRKLRADGLKSFLALGYMQAPETVFENIFQVEPGQLLVWNFKKKKIVSDSFFYQWKNEEKLLDTDIETKELFKSKLTSVVQRQLQADVPIASFLSSGVDSTLITAFANNEHNDFTAFTFGIDGDSEFDERDFAKKYAGILGVNHVTSSVNNKQLISAINEHFKAMPEPFGDYSSVPTYLITKEARKHATVMLSGDGGDELFFGYWRFIRTLRNLHWFKYPLWMRKILVPLARKWNKKLSYRLDHVKFLSDWVLERHIHYSTIDELMPKTEFTSGVYTAYNYKGSLNKKEVSNYLKKNEFYAHMQRILRKVDLCSMANSLEVRVPFLDKDIINFSNTIDSKFGIDHTISKPVLKSALYGFIPETSLNSKKQGFSVPLQTWLNKDLKEDFLKTVLDTPFYGEEFINRTCLEEDVSNFYKGKASVNHWGLWHLYAWQKWALSENLVND